MGVLRNTLKILFNEQNVEALIDNFCHFYNYKDWQKDSINRDAYIYAYTKNFSNNTQDQASSAFDIAQTKWIKPDNSGIFTYCEDDNIFNVLLHFSTQILLERNSFPICKFEQLLKWHEVTYYLGEDMFTTSFLASFDISARKDRLNFSWNSVIDHDNAYLHTLYKDKMVDIHNHLNGNGYILELNWLSLMNDVTQRRPQFQTKGMAYSKAFRTHYGTDCHDTSLYVKVIKAAVIRLYLFAEANETESTLKLSELCKILEEKSEIGIDMKLSDICSAISTTQHIFANNFDYRVFPNSFVDYAILRSASFQNENPCSNINFVLSGERFLLYKIFRKIYGNEDKRCFISKLLYIYLIIKCELAQELVQTNSSIGFANFRDYQDRKSFFLKKNTVYYYLLTQTAIRSIIDNKKKRYLETRICPKQTDKAIAKQLRGCDLMADCISNQSVTSMFQDKKVEINNWHYVAHFIKKPENGKDCSEGVQNPRNWHVRQIVKQQCLAIDHMRCYNYESAKRIVGIDAAGSELCCRPEVFAQGFRFLKNSRPERTLNNQRLPDLGVTYHVGEDFNDIVDGLRAIREAIMFLGLRNGDRIGHGLVLGIDVRKYYRNRSYAIPMSKQNILDNMAFMLVEASDLNGFDRIRMWLIRQFENYLAEVYGSYIKDYNITPFSYYQSWLLRGDTPNLYEKYGKAPDSVNNIASPWNHHSLVMDKPQREARCNDTVRYLYHLYHFGGFIKERGNSFDQLEYPKEVIPVIERLQEKILSEIESKHISIECNPSSNYKIGEITRFIEHPIARFNMISRPKKGNVHNICVSINTDDKGVFSTSLEREFALMAAAYDKKYSHNPNNSATPGEVYSWLDNIRKMGLEMAFASR